MNVSLFGASSNCVCEYCDGRLCGFFISLARAGDLGGHHEIFSIPVSLLVVELGLDTPQHCGGPCRSLLIEELCLVSRRRRRRRAVSCHIPPWGWLGVRQRQRQGIMKFPRGRLP